MLFVKCINGVTVNFKIYNNWIKLPIILQSINKKTKDLIPKESLSSYLSIDLN